MPNFDPDPSVRPEAGRVVLTVHDHGEACTKNLSPDEAKALARKILDAARLARLWKGDG